MSEFKYDYNSPEFYVGDKPEERDYIIYRNDNWVLFVQGKIQLKYNGEVLRSAFDIIRVGLDTDEKLNKAFQDGSIEPEDTPWFELFTPLEFDNGDEGVIFYEMADVESVIDGKTKREDW